ALAHKLRLPQREVTKALARLLKLEAYRRPAALGAVDLFRDGVKPLYQKIEDSVALAHVAHQPIKPKRAKHAVQQVPERIPFQFQRGILDDSQLTDVAQVIPVGTAQIVLEFGHGYTMLASFGRRIGYFENRLIPNRSAGSQEQRPRRSSASWRGEEISGSAN